MSSVFLFFADLFRLHNFIYRFVCLPLYAMWIKIYKLPFSWCHYSGGGGTRYSGEFTLDARRSPTSARGSNAVRGSVYRNRYSTPTSV